MPDTNVKVSVHYIAAVKPYMVDVPADTKLAVIKAGALKAFGLVEEGNKVYKMFANKQELANLDATVGSVAGGKHELKIDLEEFITQGNG